MLAEFWVVFLYILTSGGVHFGQIDEFTTFGECFQAKAKYELMLFEEPYTFGGELEFEHEFGIACAPMGLPDPEVFFPNKKNSPEEYENDRPYGEGAETNRFIASEVLP